MMARVLLGCALALACCALVSSSSLVLVDSQDAAYLRSGAHNVLDKADLAALMGAVTGLLPGQNVDASLSNKLEQILKPSALKKPKAFVALNIAGLPADSMNTLFQHRQHRTVELQGSGCPVTAVVNALTRLSSANPNVKMTVVDQAGLQNCKGNCVELNLGGASQICKAKVSSGSDPLSGTLTFENGVSIALKQGEDRLFGIELSSVFAGLQGELNALQQRAALQVQQEEVEVFEISFMGLHTLAQKYGKDSAVVEAARMALVQLLKWAVDGLDAAYEGDIVYQVALLESGPMQADSLKKVMAWKDATRRQLLTASSYPGPDQVQQAKQFTAKACGFAAFILLLYFGLAGTWCMCFMPFKHDTLLYGSKKDQ